MSVTGSSLFASLALICLIVSVFVDTCDGQSNHGRRIRRDATMELPFDLTTLTNMLPNPSFEEPFADKENNPWTSSATLTQYDQDYKSGSYSMKVSGRKRSLDGPSVKVRGVKPGRGYAVSGYFKLLNEKANVLWQQIRIQMQFSFTDSADKPEYVLEALQDKEVVPEDEKTVCARSGAAAKAEAGEKQNRSKSISYDLCYRGFITKADGWISLIGNINAPMREFSDDVNLRINAPDKDIEFLLDDLWLVEVPEMKDWLDKALTETDRYRKTDATLTFTMPSGVLATDIEVTVALTNHQFAFGAKVEDDCITGGPQTKRYNDFFYSVFNWATVGSYKWRFDKGTRGEPDFTNAVEATKVLRSKGIKVRAHSILWDVEENVPDWVVKLSPEETGPAVEEHVVYMVNITKGKVEQWDVQNEMVHKHYYEDKLNNQTFTMDIFNLVRRLDPNVRLYLNDYHAVTTGAQVQELNELVKRFRFYGAEINGIGIQGHTKDYVKPDPLMIWLRLNEFGKHDDLEVFVTEFDVGHNDDVIRADWYEDAIRGFFAHPVLQGHIMWGFWNQRMRYENQYLTYGPKFKLSEVATRYACLVQKEFTTRLRVRLGGSTGNQVTLRGYLGDYVVLVKKKGVLVQKEFFKLTTTTTTFDFQITAASATIEAPTLADYPKECISRRAQATLGTIKLPSTSSHLACVGRWASQSGDVSQSVSVECEENEAMTSCMSAVTGNDDGKILTKARLGERISVDSNNRPTCTAFIRKGSPTGIHIRATAVCCQMSSLSCFYRQAGPSLLMEDAMAEATCPAGSQLTGCAAYSPKSQVRGVVFKPNNLGSCLTKNGPPLPGSKPEDVSGVIASGVCCTGQNLTCSAVKSAPGHTTVTCPSNKYIMTSCSAEGSFSSADIAMSLDKRQECQVVGEIGVLALATCCITLKSPGATSGSVSGLGSDSANVLHVQKSPSSAQAAAYTLLQFLEVMLPLAVMTQVL